MHDTRVMPAGVMSDILATHECSIINGALRHNPYFVPPNDYPAMLRARERDSHT